MENIETRALETFADPPRLWKRYVDDTFVIMKRSKLSEFLTHLNTIESSIQFTMEKEGCLPFLDLLSKRSPSGHLLSAVYRKPTHSDRYLNFRSEHPTQHKQSIVSTRLERAKKLSSTAHDLNNEFKYVKRTLLLNGYPKWMIKNKKKKQYNRSPEFRPKVVLPYSTDLGETLKRILERHRIQTIFKAIFKLSTVRASGKDAVPASKRRGVVYEIPCGNCKHRYIGETKRSLNTRLKEHHRVTLPRNILKNPEKSTLAKHAAQSGRAFNWGCAHVLHHVNSYHKRIF